LRLKVSNSTPDSESSDEREKGIYESNDEGSCDQWLSGSVVGAVSKQGTIADSKRKEDLLIGIGK